MLETWYVITCLLIHVRNIRHDIKFVDTWLKHTWYHVCWYMLKHETWYMISYLLIHNRNMVDQIQTEPRGIRAEKVSVRVDILVREEICWRGKFNIKRLKDLSKKWLILSVYHCGFWLKKSSPNAIIIWIMPAE